ncbi:MAG: alanyl-tRNA ligase [Parcubacteria group bacterium Athens0714_26]|nr:MAG: alanyl-tRNA ligase [Parcubacteria group bacterium Athens0714_26]
MKSIEIRKQFLKFFKERGHKIMPSSSLIPSDSSVLLTTAGMQQFKPYYTGKADALKDFGSVNVTSAQKCFRTSDIESVGDDTHLTFFEMLGNFSFTVSSEASSEGGAGYFKKEAIKLAYEFVVDILGVSPERIYVTVFGGDHEVPEDKESFNIWHKDMGISAHRIKKCGRGDNFWGPTGAEGPCGPTTEIYVASTAALANDSKGVEIWNIVFNEYYSKIDKTLDKLSQPGVDTGMGLERLATVLQGVPNVFETDLFHPLVSKIREVSDNIDERIVRILADHLRAVIFLVADGLLPSNKEAGYILRRLLRRILVYEIKYDIHADLFPLAIEVVGNNFGGDYPEVNNKKLIAGVLSEEKSKFEKALANGLKEIEKYKEITAKDAFYIYETFGLPFELLGELVPVKVKNLKKEDFEQEFKKHQEISRAGLEKKFGGHGLVMDTGELKVSSEEEMEKVIRLHTATHLLQRALRDALGPSAHQMGSDITAERARFDFSFNRKLTEEEIKKIEDAVNEVIGKDLPVYFKEMPKEEAIMTGALFFFKEKYPDVVKVYFVGPAGGAGGEPYSAEFCGGPHVANTFKIGKIKISKQESVGSGVRRIRISLV